MKSPIPTRTMQDFKRTVKDEINNALALHKDRMAQDSARQESDRAKYTMMSLIEHNSSTKGATSYQRTRFSNNHKSSIVDKSGSMQFTERDQEAYFALK